MDYLIVAGGGSGASGNSGNTGGGGGGAGGMRTTANLAITGGTVYTITVGAGAAPVNAGLHGAVSANGGDSVLSGSNISTITSLGGGSARTYSATPTGSPTGGSGGGGVWHTITRGLGTSNQGSAGGAGTNGSTYGGGGGGAGAVGNNSPNGIGGAGIANSYSGSSVFYAGGGGAWNRAGGSGGGGTGYSTAGSANTGGGGGGGGGGSVGYSGGSGIVIIRYSDVHSAAVTTGSPIYTVAGGFRIYKFTSSGTITF